MRKTLAKKKYIDEDNGNEKVSCWEDRMTMRTSEERWWWRRTDVKKMEGDRRDGRWRRRMTMREENEEGRWWTRKMMQKKCEEYERRSWRWKMMKKKTMMRMKVMMKKRGEDERLNRWCFKNWLSGSLIKIWFEFPEVYRKFWKE